LQEAIEAIAAIGTTTVVVLLFGIQTVLFFAIQAHPVFVIPALLLWVTQALLLWVTQALLLWVTQALLLWVIPRVKVILVSPPVTPEIMDTPEIMGTPEVLFVSDNEIQWFAHEFAYDAWTQDILDHNLDRHVPCQSVPSSSTCIGKPVQVKQLV
jgi:hypothetical protein